MISESVFPKSGKRWGKLLPHVLDMHGGLEGEKNAPKTPTGCINHDDDPNKPQYDVQSAIRKQPVEKEQA